MKIGGKSWKIKGKIVNLPGSIMQSTRSETLIAKFDLEILSDQWYLFIFFPESRTSRFVDEDTIPKIKRYWSLLSQTTINYTLAARKNERPTSSLTNLYEQLHF